MSAPPKRRALGRGLAALIPGSAPTKPGAPPAAPAAPAAAPPAAAPPAALTTSAAAGSTAPAPVPAPTITPTPARRDSYLVPIEEVHPSALQPRRNFDEEKLAELAASIREEGLIQPIVVRARSEAEGGGFAIIAGERRWRASQRAGLHDVPVVVREATEARAFELALVENVQRADLDPIEEAEAYQHLSDTCGYTQDRIAERVGKDRTTIANAMRLLKLSPAVRELVQAGKLSMGHARALLGLDEAQAIETLARKVVARALSVRATEELVRRERGGTPHPPEPEKSPAVRDLEQRLTRSLGAKVRIQDRGGGKGGRLEIAYLDLDDLDRLLDRLFGANQG